MPVIKTVSIWKKRSQNLLEAWSDDTKDVLKQVLREMSKEESIEDDDFVDMIRLLLALSELSQDSFVKATSLSTDQFKLWLDRKNLPDLSKRTSIIDLCPKPEDDYDIDLKKLIDIVQSTKSEGNFSQKYQLGTALDDIPEFRDTVDTRGRNLLEHDNIITLDKLRTKSVASLLSRPNFGRKSLNQIQRFLTAIGYPKLL